MKKTIAVLFALSSLAFAENFTLSPIKDMTWVVSGSGWVNVDSEDESVNTGTTHLNIKWTENETATCDLSDLKIDLQQGQILTLEFTMDIAAPTQPHYLNNTMTVALIGTSQALVVGHSYSGNSDVYVAQSPDVSRNGYTFGDNLTNTQYYGSNDKLVGLLSDNFVSSHTAVVSVAWDATKGETGNYVATLSSPETSQTASILLGNSFDVSQLKITLNGNSAPMVKGLTLTLTPEPATATLSLLALAALASRRKRH